MGSTMKMAQMGRPAALRVLPKATRPQTGRCDSLEEARGSACARVVLQGDAGEQTAGVEREIEKRREGGGGGDVKEMDTRGACPEVTIAGETLGQHFSCTFPFMSCDFLSIFSFLPSSRGLEFKDRCSSLTSFSSTPQRPCSSAASLSLVRVFQPPRPPRLFRGLRFIVSLTRSRRDEEGGGGKETSLRKIYCGAFFAFPLPQRERTTKGPCGLRILAGYGREIGIQKIQAN